MFVNPGIVNLICDKNTRSTITGSHDRAHKMGFAVLLMRREQRLDLTNRVLMLGCRMTFRNLLTRSLRSSQQTKTHFSFSRFLVKASLARRGDQVLVLVMSSCSGGNTLPCTCASGKKFREGRQKTSDIDIVKHRGCKFYYRGWQHQNSV